MARTRRRRPPVSSTPESGRPSLPDLPEQVLAPAFEWPRPGGDQVGEGREVGGDRAQERPIRVDPPPLPARVRRPAGGEGPGSLALPSPPTVAPDRASVPVRGVRPGAGPGRIAGSPAGDDPLPSASPPRRSPPASGATVEASIPRPPAVSARVIVPDRAPLAARRPGSGVESGRIAGSSAGDETTGGAVDWLIRRVRGEAPRPSASPVDRSLPRNYRELEPGQGLGLYVPPVRSVGEVPGLFLPVPPDRRGVAARALDWLNPVAPVRGRALLPSGLTVPYAPALPEGSPRYVDRNPGSPASESLDEFRGRQFAGLRDRLRPFVGERSPGDGPRLIRPGPSPAMLPDELTLEQFERLRKRVMVEADERRGIGSRRPGPVAPAVVPGPSPSGGPTDASPEVSGPAGDPNGPGPGASFSFPSLDGRSGVRTELDELLERLERLERGPRVGYDLAGGLPGSNYRMG